jgi:hypothetical protein
MFLEAATQAAYACEEVDEAEFLPSRLGLPVLTDDAFKLVDRCLAGSGLTRSQR